MPVLLRSAESGERAVGIFASGQLWTVCNGGGQTGGTMPALSSFVRHDKERGLRPFMKGTALAVGFWLNLLFCNNQAATADYIVNYALEVDGKTDSGKKETCEYVRPCEIVSESAGVRVVMNFTYPDHLSVYTHVYGQLGCCYFRDGADSIALDPKLPLHHLQIFEGRARRQNEFVQNRKVGILYLSFSDMRQ